LRRPPRGVYDPGKPGNEERSAALLAAAADVMGLAPVTRDHAAAIVRATAHAAAGGAAAPDPDTAVALDIDLAVLGRPAAGFDRYEAAVREEFGFLGETEWREGRRRLLQGFLARPRIYLTDRFSAAYEARARRNLQRSLARLNAPSGRPPTRRR
jgi:predicted metal-dependent HD superfamily phosphohydrolase